MKGNQAMSVWFFYALAAAVLYGGHQIFTKLAAERISDGLGGFVVEATAALTILLYLAALRFGGAWNQTASAPGVWYSVLTGRCNRYFNLKHLNAGLSSPICNAYFASVLF